MVVIVTPNNSRTVALHDFLKAQGIGQLGPDATYAQWFEELRRFSAAVGHFRMGTVRVRLAPGFFDFVVNNYDDRKPEKVLTDGKATYFDLGPLYCEPEFQINWDGRPPFRVKRSN